MNEMDTWTGAIKVGQVTALYNSKGKQQDILWNCQKFELESMLILHNALRHFLKIYAAIYFAML